MDEGGAGQRRRATMLSIQSDNQLKTLVLIGSFLTCGLGGSFCQNLLVRSGGWGNIVLGLENMFKRTLGMYNCIIVIK
jgi:hypothetical protein